MTGRKLGMTIAVLSALHVVTICRAYAQTKGGCELISPTADMLTLYDTPYDAVPSGTVSKVGLGANACRVNEEPVNSRYKIMLNKKEKWVPTAQLQVHFGGGLKRYERKPEKPPATISADKHKEWNVNRAGARAPTETPALHRE